MKFRFIAMVICFYSVSIVGVAAQRSNWQQPPKKKTDQSQKTAGKIPENREKQAENIKRQDEGDVAKFQRRHKLLNEVKYKWLDAALGPLMVRNGRSDAMNFFGEVGISIIGFACTNNIFWKEDIFQEAIYAGYISRIQLIPKEAEREWTDAITKVSEGALQMMYNIGAIILQDRLFDANGFRQNESAVLLARLNSIPQHAVNRWASAHSLAKHVAAVSIINDDTLFIKDVFQLAAFEKKLKSGR